VSNQELLTQYQELTAKIKKLEAAVEQVKKMRSEIAKALLDANGKDYLYDLGDGAKLFISGTKSGTYFLAPKKSKGQKDKTEGEPTEAGEEPTEVKTEPTAAPVSGGEAKKRGRGRPPLKLKKVLIDGKIVEIPVTGSAKAAPGPTENLPLHKRNTEHLERKAAGTPAETPKETPLSANPKGQTPEAKKGNIIEVTATLRPASSVSIPEPEPNEKTPDVQTELRPTSHPVLNGDTASLDIPPQSQASAPTEKPSVEADSTGNMAPITLDSFPPVVHVDSHTIVASADTGDVTIEEEDILDSSKSDSEDPTEPSEDISNVAPNELPQEEEDPLAAALASLEVE